MRIDLGQPFDNCGWALLPSQEILNAVYEYFQDVLENCLNGTMNTEDVKITNWLEVCPFLFSIKRHLLLLTQRVYSMIGMQRDISSASSRSGHGP